MVAGGTSVEAAETSEDSAALEEALSVAVAPGGAGRLVVRWSVGNSGRVEDLKRGLEIYPRAN